MVDPLVPEMVCEEVDGVTKPLLIFEQGSNVTEKDPWNRKIRDIAYKPFDVHEGRVFEGRRVAPLPCRWNERTGGKATHMKQRILAAAFTVALAGGSLAPALADGAASTRNIIIISGAAVVIGANIVRKNRQKREQVAVADRRQDAYRDWFYHKYGYYPTDDQFKQWYYQTYGTNPE